MFEGYAWRSRREAIVQAWHVAAYFVGSDDMPTLAEVLDEKVTSAPTPQEYHERMRELGLE